MALLIVVVGCSGSKTPTATKPPVTPPPGPTGPQTLTFSGTASTTDAGGCSSPGHTISAAAGSITVTHTQSSAARLKVQVCDPAAQDHRNGCTIPPFASLAVGESAMADRKGASAQVVTVYPQACGSPGNPPAESLTYTVTVAFTAG